MRAEFPAYIAIEGPIGVGKTTLAHHLAATFDAELLLEAPFDNPFLPRFYRDPRPWALSAQLSFLLQRARQMRELRQRSLFGSVTVSDFMLEKDRLFARLNLDADELDLYEQVYERVIDEAPTPDVIVYLQAPVPLLLQRIEKRGIAFERGMEADYLERLAAAYREYFGTRPVGHPPVLAVNTGEVDFVNRIDHRERLITRLSRPWTGVRIFDPDSFVEEQAR